MAQVAVLAALQRQDARKDLLPLAHHFFNLPQRVAQDQLAQVKRRQPHATGGRSKEKPAGAAAVGQVAALLQAAGSLKDAQCCRGAAECAQQAVLLAQQLSFN